MSRSYTHDFSDQATLAELREFVEATRDLPGSALLGVRIGFGGAKGRSGSRPTKIIASEQAGGSRA